MGDVGTATALARDQATKAKGFVGSCDGGWTDIERICELSNGGQRFAGACSTPVQAALDGTGN